MKQHKDSVIRFKDSDLGKIQFVSCDLRRFNHFEFSNSKMLDIFIGGSQMPNENAFRLPIEATNLIETAEQKRLAYGQFKRINEIKGDIAGSLPYLAFELEAYREQLLIEGWWKNRGELSMLWINKISTNYGNSWSRGLLMTFISLSVCFTIFCWMRGYRFGSDWKLFGELVSFAPYYLNPLRDLDSVSLISENNNTPIEWYARLWDFISRIIVAYFAYQTIQAFRKLGKSSG